MPIERISLDSTFKYMPDAVEMSLQTDGRVRERGASSNEGDMSEKVLWIRIRIRIRKDPHREYGSGSGFRWLMMTYKTRKHGKNLLLIFEKRLRFHMKKFRIAVV
jgi:hypothetical protein